MSGHEIVCPNCAWQGKWKDIAHSFSDIDAALEGREKRRDYCPECNLEVEFIDLDAVTEKDYIEQNPLEVPKE